MWIKHLCIVLHCLLWAYNNNLVVWKGLLCCCQQMRTESRKRQQGEEALSALDGHSCLIIFSHQYHYSIEFLIVTPNLPYFESSLSPKDAIALSSAAGAFHDVLKLHFLSPFFPAACCEHQLTKSLHPRGGCISLVMYCADIQFKSGLKIKILIIGLVVFSILYSLYFNAAVISLCSARRMCTDCQHNTLCPEQATKPYRVSRDHFIFQNKFLAYFIAPLRELRTIEATSLSLGLNRKPLPEYRSMCTR